MDDYFKYLIIHSELTHETLRPRFPGETKESWTKDMLRAQNNLEYFEEKYPEYTKIYKMQKQYEGLF